MGWIAAIGCLFLAFPFGPGFVLAAVGCLFLQLMAEVAR